MKKSKIILLGATFLVTLGLSFTSPTQASTSDQNTAATTQSNSDVPESVQNAVDDLFDNYMTNDTVDVTDASFSYPTVSTTEKTLYSFNEFSKLPLVKRYFLKPGFSQSNKLNNVRFSFGSHRPDESDGDVTNWIIMGADYNGKDIGSKIIHIKSQYDYNNPNNLYMDPIDLTGKITATHKEGQSYAPLLDTENEKSNRALAPNSDWYTDKFMISKRYATLYYRVSTSEWVNEYYIKPQSNTNIRISDVISNPRDRKFTVSYRRISGQPLYKSNGELWDYTLPNNSQWKVTSIGFDQYGVAYCQVSTDAWARVDIV